MQTGKPKAPDFSAIRGKKGQVLFCTKSDGNIDQYKYVNVKDLPLEDGITVGDLLNRLSTLEEDNRKLTKTVKAIGNQTIKTTVHAVEGSNVL